jgi:hypothetical protein
VPCHTGQALPAALAHRVDVYAHMGCCGVAAGACDLGCCRQHTLYQTTPLLTFAAAAEEPSVSSVTTTSPFTPGQPASSSAKVQQRDRLVSNSSARGAGLVSSAYVTLQCTIVGTLENQLR